MTPRQKFAVYGFVIFCIVAIFAAVSPLPGQGTPTPKGLQVVMSDGSLRTFTLGTLLMFQGTTVRVQYVDFFSQPTTVLVDTAGNPTWKLNRAAAWKNLQVFRNGLVQVAYVDATNIMTCPAPFVKDPAGNDITQIILGDFTFARGPGIITPRYTVDGTPTGAPLYNCDGTQAFNWDPRDIVITNYQY